MSPSLQRIESEGKVFVVFVGGVEVVFCRVEKIGDDGWSRKFHREQQRAAAVHHQVFMQKGIQGRGRDKLTDLPRSSQSGPRLLQGRQRVEESMRSQRGVNLI